MVDVVQLVRTSDCDSEGRGFESHHSPEKVKDRRKAVFLHEGAGCTRKNKIVKQAYNVVRVNYGLEKGRTVFVRDGCTRFFKI